MNEQFNEDFWYDFMGACNEEDADFTGFNVHDVLRKVDPADESDLDIDFDALLEEMDPTIAMIKKIMTIPSRWAGIVTKMDGAVFSGRLKSKTSVNLWESHTLCR